MIDVMVVVVVLIVDGAIDVVNVSVVYDVAVTDDVACVIVLVVACVVCTVVSDNVAAYADNANMIGIDVRIAPLCDGVCGCDDCSACHCCCCC